MVNNLVKNWEIEASYKPILEEWRTVDPKTYVFSMNGGPKISGHDMLSVGTYNALLGSSQFYDPEYNDFEASHKSFKRMIPSFVWDVEEVYSGPPAVTAKWRHWGVMKNDWTGRNGNGEMVRVKAHGGTLSIEGLMVAKVNDKFQITSIEIWYDPMSIFHEIAREAKNRGVEIEPLQGEQAAAAAAAAQKCPYSGAAPPSAGAGAGCPLAPQ